jgi:hypothetical protein
MAIHSNETIDLRGRALNKSRSNKAKSETEYEIEEDAQEAEQKVSMNHLPNNVLHFWSAPEYEMKEKSQKWLMVAALILIVFISYAVYSNSPIMAFTFILIGVVGYILINKKPNVVEFAITDDGVAVGNELYEYHNIHSFWIFYEPGEIKAISLFIDSKLNPYVHIPLANEDPVKIRELLLQYIPEKRQEFRLVDRIDQML